MDKTFKSIVHALRLSGINIPKNSLLPSQLLGPVSSSEEEDMDGIEEEDGHDRDEEHAHDSEEDGREQDHWNANSDPANEVHSDSRSPMLDTTDKLTRPTVCSLLDGTVELALAKVFPSQKACHSVPVQDGYVVVQPTYVWANASQYPLSVSIDGGDVATLAEALVQRIQWPKDRPKDKIIIPPMMRHPNLETATSSRGITLDGGAAAQCQEEKAELQQQQQQISKTTQQERRQQLEEEPRQTLPKQQLQLEDNQQTKQQPLQQQERRQQQEEPGQTTPKQQLQHEDKQQTKQQPLQQEEECDKPSQENTVISPKPIHFGH
jgi:hypothetical protein